MTKKAAKSKAPLNDAAAGGGTGVSYQGQTAAFCSNKPSAAEAVADAEASGDRIWSYVGVMVQAFAFFMALFMAFQIRLHAVINYGKVKVFLVSRDDCGGACVWAAKNSNPSSPTNLGAAGLPLAACAGR